MQPDKIIPIVASAILAFNQVITPIEPAQSLASHEISLKNRYPVASVSDIFQDNILLNLAYMRGLIQAGDKIDWNEVTKPFNYEFRLAPNKTFAYHDDVLPEYKDSLVKTTQAHFNAADGFKTDGYLYGDGVCHLASLMYWVAKDAGLDTKAPVNHDFASIPEINKQFGVSIYSNNKQQNLYITNNTDKEITFHFEYSDDKLKLAILKEAK